MKRLDSYYHIYQQADGGYVGDEYDMDGETVNIDFENVEDSDNDDSYVEADIENGENQNIYSKAFDKVVSTWNQILDIKKTGDTEVLKNFDKTNIGSNIINQINALKNLEDKIKEATQKAKDTREICQLYNGGNWWDRLWDSEWDAIEATQKAVREIADSLTANAEAQKLTYSYMKTTNETCKYLIALGMMSLANNRTVVTKLKMQLEQASKEEISAYARAELQSVIDQLVAQEDLIKKYDKLKECFESQEETINKLREDQRATQEGLSEKYKELKGDISTQEETINKLQEDQITKDKEYKQSMETMSAELQELKTQSNGKQTISYVAIVIAIVAVVLKFVLK